MAGQATVTIRDRQWTCPVASTPAELATGLRGVPGILPGTGMLFVLPGEQIITVTAEGMLFPLSVIFISGILRVTEVALMLAPGDWGTTSLPCRYFLEVNAGEADGIEPDEQVSIELTAVPPAPTNGWMAPVVTLAGMTIAGAFMAKMGKTMADAVFGNRKEKPTINGPRGGKLFPQAAARGRQPAVITIGPRLRRLAKQGELEFLPDSPEFLAYTIDDIGYRDRLDNAFLQAIARARRER